MLDFRRRVAADGMIHLKCPEKSLLRDSTYCEISIFSRETRHARGRPEHCKWDSTAAAPSKCEAPATRISHRQGSGEAHRRRAVAREIYGVPRRSVCDSEAIAVSSKNSLRLIRDRSNLRPNLERRPPLRLSRRPICPKADSALVWATCIRPIPILGFQRLWRIPR